MSLPWLPESSVSVSSTSSSSTSDVPAEEPALLSKSAEDQSGTSASSSSSLSTAVGSVTGGHCFPSTPLMLGHQQANEPNQGQSQVFTHVTVGLRQNDIDLSIAYVFSYKHLNASLDNLHWYNWNNVALLLVLSEYAATAK
eukprot:scpid87913/ scgid28435/ 